LKRVWDLRHEIAFYMDSKEKPHGFSNAQWLSKAAFLVDITEKTNYLNASLQGKENLFKIFLMRLKHLKQS